MYLILNPLKHGYVADDTWTSELQTSKSFATKAEALDFVRAHAQQFVGCRVVSLLDAALARLLAIGHKAKLVDGQLRLENATSDAPREIFGIPIRGIPHPVKKPVLKPWQLPRPKKQGS
jgi:hypothetical protein